MRALLTTSPSYRSRVPVAQKVPKSSLGTIESKSSDDDDSQHSPPGACEKSERAMKTGNFTGLPAFDHEYVDSTTKKSSVLAAGAAPDRSLRDRNIRYHPANHLTGAWNCFVRWHHQVVRRYGEEFVNDFKVGYCIHVEGEPSKLGGSEDNSWCITYGLTTWLCSTLQFSAYVTEFEHPYDQSQRISFDKLLTEHLDVAEEVLNNYKFPVLTPGQGTSKWGEYIVLNASLHSYGPYYDFQDFLAKYEAMSRRYDPDFNDHDGSSESERLLIRTEIASIDKSLEDALSVLISSGRRGARRGRMSLPLVSEPSDVETGKKKRRKVIAETNNAAPLPSIEPADHEEDADEEEDEEDGAYAPKVQRKKAAKAQDAKRKRLVKAKVLNDLSEGQNQPPTLSTTRAKNQAAPTHAVNHATFIRIHGFGPHSLGEASDAADSSEVATASRSSTNTVVALAAANTLTTTTRVYADLTALEGLHTVPNAEEIPLQLPNEYRRPDVVMIDEDNMNSQESEEAPVQAITLTSGEGGTTSGPQVRDTSDLSTTTDGLGVRSDAVAMPDNRYEDLTNLAMNEPDEFRRSQGGEQAILVNGAGPSPVEPREAGDLLRQAENLLGGAETPRAVGAVLLVEILRLQRVIEQQSQNSSNRCDPFIDGISFNVNPDETLLGGSTFISTSTPQTSSRKMAAIRRNGVHWEPVEGGVRASFFDRQFVFKGDNTDVDDLRTMIQRLMPKKHFPATSVSDLLMLEKAVKDDVYLKDLWKSFSGKILSSRAVLRELSKSVLCLLLELVEDEDYELLYAVNPTRSTKDHVFVSILQCTSEMVRDIREDDHEVRDAELDLLTVLHRNASVRNHRLLQISGPTNQVNGITYMNDLKNLIYLPVKRQVDKFFEKYQSHDPHNCAVLHQHGDVCYATSRYRFCAEQRNSTDEVTNGVLGQVNNAIGKRGGNTTTFKDEDCFSENDTPEVKQHKIWFKSQIWSKYCEKHRQELKSKTSSKSRSGSPDGSDGETDVEADHEASSNDRQRGGLRRQRGRGWGRSGRGRENQRGSTGRRPAGTASVHGRRQGFRGVGNTSGENAELNVDVGMNIAGRGDLPIVSDPDE